MATPSVARADFAVVLAPVAAGIGRGDAGQLHGPGRRPAVRVRGLVSGVGAEENRPGHDGREQGEPDQEQPERHQAPAGPAGAARVPGPAAGLRP